MSAKLKIFHKMQVAHAALFRAANRRTRTKLGLSSSQLAVLFLLSRQDGMPLSEISATLAMSKSSLTGLIDRMCNKNLVCRIPSSQDGRITYIHMCDKGRGLLEQGKVETRFINHALLDAFSEDEQSIIDKFLTYISDNADHIINHQDASQND